MSLNEADTCRVYVVPKIKDARWDQRPHSISEQRIFTAGRVQVRGNIVRRKKRKRADYLLLYTRDFAIAVIEAKPEFADLGAGMQQAKDYAEILGLMFAYATDGHRIIEFDYLTGQTSLI